MAYTVPKFTKSQVNRAGAILVSPDRSLDDFIWAYEVLANWRAAHGYPINTFQATLRTRLKSIDPKAIVAQRLKRLPSILDKLIRFNTMELARMQDIGGLRAIVGSINKVRELEKKYRDGRFQHQLVSSKDYINEPKPDGYRGIHLIFRYKNDRAIKYNGLHIELQLRTKLQHAWATAVETMGTFLGQALKSGQGDDSWRQFFAITASAIAHTEKTVPVPGFKHLSQIETYAMVAKVESELRVLEKLSGFSIAADRISEEKGQGSFHLIVLDSEKKTVSIRPYPRNKLEQANEDYAAIEKRAQNGEQLEAVLVSAGPIEALKRAYPNYFLDTHEFIRQVSKMIAESKKTS